MVTLSLVVSRTDSESLSDCRSDQGDSMVTYEQISFETATRMPRTSALAEVIVKVQTTPLRVPFVWSYQS